MADIGLLFRQGTLAQLKNAELIAGSINVTTDEPAIYIDVPNAEGTQTIRKRVGDLIIVPNEEALMTDTTGKVGVVDGALVGEWSKSALYYAEEEGALLKWNGTSWKQLNALSDVDAAVDGLTQSVGSLQTGFAEISSTVSSNTGKIDTLTETVGSIPEGASATTVVGYIDEKVSEVDGKVSTLSGTVETLSGTVDTLNTQVVENKNTVDNSIAEINAKDEAQDKTINDLDAAYKAADTAINQSITDLGTTINGVNQKTQQNATAIGENLEKITANTASIEALQGTTTTHTNDIAANEAAISKEVEDRIAAVSGVQNSLNNHITAYNTKVAEIENAYKVADEGILASAKTYTDNSIEAKLQAADAMTFKGVLGTDEGQISNLPTGIVGNGEKMVNAGDTYKVSVAGTYGPDNIQGYVGDLFIALKDQMDQNDPSTYTSGWAHVSSGYESDYNPHLTAITADNGVNGITIKLSGGADENLGTEHIVGSTNIKVSRNAADATTTFSLVWGSFEP